MTTPDPAPAVVNCSRQHAHGEDFPAVRRVQLKAPGSGRVLSDGAVCQAHLDMEMRTAQFGMAEVVVLPLAPVPAATPDPAPPWTSDDITDPDVWRACLSGPNVREAADDPRVVRRMIEAAMTEVGPRIAGRAARAERERLAAVIPPERFRKLAHWFDIGDADLNAATFRRFADLLEGEA